MENPKSLKQLKIDLNRSLYDLVLHLGDFAYNLDTNDGVVGDNFMNMIQPISSRVPYMTCPGNHESLENFTQYRLRYNMPWKQSYSDSNLYYSYDIGDVHLIGISTELYYYDYYYNDIIYKTILLK